MSRQQAASVTRWLRESLLLAPRTPVLRQTEMSDCGLACLAAIAQRHGQSLTLADLKIQFGLSLRGSSLYELMKIAGELGFVARGVQFRPQQLREVALPAILHWDANHFVVLDRVTAARVEIMDPAVGRREYTHRELQVHASGYALELFPQAAASGDRRGNGTRSARVVDFVLRNPSTWAFLKYSLLLTLVIQLASLANPFFVQLVIDQAVSKADRGILSLLMWIFGLIALWDIAARYLRGTLHVELAARVHTDAKMGLVQRLLRLPQSWFDARQPGRAFQALRQIDVLRSALSEQSFAALADGVFSLISLGVMLLISVKLALLSTGVLGIYLAARELTLRRIRACMSAQIAAGARADTALMRLIDDIQAIKLSTSESTRLNRWLNLHVEASRQGLWLQRAGYRLSVFAAALRQAERLAVIYLSALDALDGKMSVGVVIAYLLFRDQFLDKAVGCVQAFYELRQSGTALGELTDIAEAAVEPQGAGFLKGEAPVEGGLEVRLEQVSYRHSSFSLPVLREVTLRLAAGAKVAVVGNSGSGKSTLLKVLAGLYTPSAGVVRFDGVDLRQQRTLDYRNQIALVDARPAFLNASLLENIYFEAEAREPRWAVECARMAGLHEEVLRQPGGYALLLDESGRTLSSGQSQRLLLARALYLRPRLLLMDEPTGHLDARLEQSIVERLLGLQTTMVFVSHNPAVVRRFRVVWRVEAGEVREGS